MLLQNMAYDISRVSVFKPTSFDWLSVLRLGSKWSSFKFNLNIAKYKKKLQQFFYIQYQVQGPRKKLGPGIK